GRALPARPRALRHRCRAAPGRDPARRHGSRGLDRARMGGGALGSAPVNLGVMGGTFDPIHLGHLAVAEEAREVLDLEWILFVPAGRPPHKPAGEVTSIEHRLAMAELAIADNPAFALSRIE